MTFKNLRWRTAGLLAFLMGIPMAEQAPADDGSAGNIIEAAIGLTLSIIDIAGDS
ncbi:MAG: hypothetical protein CHACPFDD_03118 [Phycisphaerae bacterium]|nr:hypothetical protein [Phycisphaerae bacterium]